MYSYQHRYHAGNFADIHKHLGLLATLESFHKKETPYAVLDAFAGEGVYDLTCMEAKKTNEFETGFHKLLKAPNPPALVQKFIQMALKLDDQKQTYPGSGFIIQETLRPQDRGILIENHPQAFELLKNNLKSPLVEIHKRDAYEAIKAFTPFKEKRGLVFLDPSFEVKEEYQTIAKAVLNNLKKFSHGVFMIWYPILKPRYHQILVEALSSHPKTYQSEFVLFPNEQEGLLGSGLFVINPPWQLEEELNPVFDYLKNIL